MTSKVVYLENLRTEIEHSASGQKSITDAPLDNNGKGEAFSPTDLLATSLASCMITVMGIKAQQLGIEMKGTYARVHKKMESTPRRVAQIDVQVFFVEQYTIKEKSLLERIALNCPVAKSLSVDVMQNVTFHYNT